MRPGLLLAALLVLAALAPRLPAAELVVFLPAAAAADPACSGWTVTVVGKQRLLAAALLREPDLLLLPSLAASELPDWIPLRQTHLAGRTWTRWRLVGFAGESAGQGVGLLQECGGETLQAAFARAFPAQRGLTLRPTARSHDLGSLLALEAVRCLAVDEDGLTALKQRFASPLTVLAEGPALRRPLLLAPNLRIPARVPFDHLRPETWAVLGLSGCTPWSGTAGEWLMTPQPAPTDQEVKP